jgi:uncharacterized protein (DUF58 family)
MATEGTLLEPGFIRELEALRRRLDIRARSGAAGNRSARRRGSSSEFEQHAPYTQGEDPRHIDWLAFARSGQPVLKHFRAEEDAVVRILLDCSRSLDFGEPGKFEIARRLAAAVAYLALSNGQRAQLLTARQGQTPETEHRMLERSGTPRRGREAFGTVLRELGAAHADGTLDLGRAIGETLVRLSRPGLLVVISDFLDPGPVISALTRARSGGHDVALIQVLDGAELDPPYEGDAVLVDSETGSLVEVTLDADARHVYSMRVAGLLEELRSWARRSGASYVRTTTGDGLELPIRRFLAHAVD